MDEGTLAEVTRLLAVEGIERATDTDRVVWDNGSNRGYLNAPPEIRPRHFYSVTREHYENVPESAGEILSGRQPPILLRKNDSAERIVAVVQEQLKNPC